MAHADQHIIDFLTDYFAAMQAKDLQALGTFYDPDITFTFANAATVTGRDVVLAQMSSLLSKVDSLAHPLLNVWQVEAGVVVLEVISDWRFPDGTQASIKACSIFTITDGQFTDQRIYVDNSSINGYLT